MKSQKYLFIMITNIYVALSMCQTLYQELHKGYLVYFILMTPDKVTLMANIYVTLF